MRKQTTTPNLFEYIEGHTIRLEASRRGGGIEIDAAEYLGHDGIKITAYQNYLGGGMTGAIGNDCNLRDWEKTPLADGIRKLMDAAARYFYNETNGLVQDWGEFAELQGLADYIEPGDVELLEAAGVPEGTI